MGNRAAVKLFNIPLLQSAALANLYTDFSCLAEGRRLSWPEYTVGYLKKRPIRVEPAPTLSTACTVVNMHASAQCTRHEPSKRFSPASAKRAVKSHESCSANLQLLYGTSVAAANERLSKINHIRRALYGLRPAKFVAERPPIACRTALLHDPSVGKLDESISLSLVHIIRESVTSAAAAAAITTRWMYHVVVVVAVAVGSVAAAAHS